MNKTYLYIKQHSSTGLLYLGKTQKTDPVKYLGSGKFWRNHIKKHGEGEVKTLWISEPFFEKKDIEELALFLSEFFDIVQSKKWANLKNENGLDGNPRGTGNMNLGTRENMLNGLKHALEKNKGRKRPEHGKYMREFWKNNPDKLVVNKRENFKHTDETKIKLSNASKLRPKVCCMLCHKNEEDNLGISTCHFFNHHRHCDPYA